MNLFRVLPLAPKPQRMAPPVNKFRSVAVDFTDDAGQALPLIRRLIELHQRGAQAFPQSPRASLHLPYDLLVIGLLLPAEAGRQIMQPDHYNRLKSYLERQKYELVRDRMSPFYDVSAQALYSALLAVLNAMEDFTSIKPLSLYGHL